MARSGQVSRAVRWLGTAPRGATCPQRFALDDGRQVFVKFSQNPQGERVLANEFICSRFAALVGAPVPEVMLVEVPDDLLDEARLAAACPSSFMGGIHAGAVVLSGAEAVPISKIESTVRSVVNAADWAALEIFDQIVKRDDKIEIITYRKLDGRRYFASIDYGFSFGGTPDWDRESLQG